MEEIKDRLKSLSDRQKIEIIVGIVTGILMILAVVFMFKAFRGGDYTNSQVEGLHRQNEQLEKNNQKLIETVQQLETTVMDRSARDSALFVQVAANNRVLPEINNKLNAIDRNYAKTITSIRGASVAELERYVAAEADRLRRDSPSR